MEQGTASRSLAESVQRIDSFIPSTVSNTNKLVDESTLNANLGEKLVVKVCDEISKTSQGAEQLAFDFSSQIPSGYELVNLHYLVKNGVSIDTTAITGMFLYGDSVVVCNVNRTLNVIVKAKMILREIS